MPIAITVREAMDQAVAIGLQATVSEAIHKMIQAGIWSLVVENQGLPVGVVTDHDVLRRLLALGGDPNKVKVEDIMSSPIITIEPDVRASDALKTMIEKKVSRLYVVANAKIIGRITRKGLSENLLDVMIALNSVTQQL